MRTPLPRVQCMGVGINEPSPCVFCASALCINHAHSCMHYNFIAGDAFRDPTNGLYCDHFPFDGTDAATNRAAALSGAPVCDGQQYSSAATGMGLVATCAFAEMGLLSKAEAEKRALQTLESLATLWPREKFNGFFVHFCNRGSPTFRATSEYSTVDTAEMAMGALFAGNYFGGAVQRAAQKIAKEVKWSVAIESAISPTIYPTVNAVSPTQHAARPPFFGSAGTRVFPSCSCNALKQHCTGGRCQCRQQAFPVAIFAHTTNIT